MSSFLSTLTPDQVRTVLRTLGPDLAVFANSAVDVTGATLSTLTTPTLVKRSAYHELAAGGLERSMLAKEVRKLMMPMFEPKLQALFRPPAPAFQPLAPGTFDSPVPWHTIHAAFCSEDGSTGVIFVNTDAGGYVIKASAEPARELFATELALHLNIPAAKQIVVTRLERTAIIRRLSELSAKAAKAQHTSCDGDADGMLAIHLKLWSVITQRPFLTAIALVPGAGLLCGMDTVTAQMQLDPKTDGGAKRLRQIGELICLDAFLNNNDRIPVVHSNVGNGRNVMFSQGTEGDVVAIDQVVTCFHCALVGAKATRKSGPPTPVEATVTAVATAAVAAGGEAKENSTITLYEDCLPACKLRANQQTLLTKGHHASCSHCQSTPTSFKSSKSSMANMTTQLYTEYVNRVERWLHQCLTFENASSAQKSSLRQQSVHAELGKVPLRLMEELKVSYGMNDRLAESVVRVSGFEPGTAHMIAEHPTMLTYAAKRGPRICVEGSLLAVRDFIVRQCGYDVDDIGVAVIRQGVCACARKIAGFKKEELVELREKVALQMTNSELNDASESEWQELVHGVVNLQYLETMQQLFGAVVEEVDPPPCHVLSLRTPSGNDVYMDEASGRMYKFDKEKGVTRWCEEGEVLVEGGEVEVGEI